MRQAAVEQALGEQPRTPTARSLLLTLLGEFVLPGGGSAWTSTLVDALATVGVEEKAARQAVARSADRGLLQAEQIGRRTRWHLTDHATRLLTEGTERIYSFHHRSRVWDECWVVVVVRVPESNRQARHRLRTRLGWAGFAPMAPGVWLSPWREREAEAREVLENLGLEKTATSFVGAHGAIGDTAAIVAEAWDLDGIEAEYRRFLDRHTAVAPTDPRDAFAALTLLIHEWRRLPFVDPDLPAELLPAQWIGDRAGHQFHELHDRWKPDALEWWSAH